MTNGALSLWNEASTNWRDGNGPEPLALVRPQSRLPSPATFSVVTLSEPMRVEAVLDLLTRGDDFKTLATSIETRVINDPATDGRLKPVPKGTTERQRM